MKMSLLSAFAVATLFVSCKKEDNKACDNTVAAIAGNYKITKITLAGQDVTANFFNDDCEKDDIFELKADKSMLYKDAGTACSPSSAGDGSWDIVNGTITVTHSGSGMDVSGTVSNKCNGFDVTQTQSSITLVTTFTKQ